MTAPRARHLNPFLAIAIVAVPVVFVWGLLWPGSFDMLRRAMLGRRGGLPFDRLRRAFVYAGAHVMVAVIGVLVGWVE